MTMIESEQTRSSLVSELPAKPSGPLSLINQPNAYQISNYNVQPNLTVLLTEEAIGETLKRFTNFSLM